MATLFAAILRISGYLWSTSRKVSVCTALNSSGYICLDDSNRGSRRSASKLALPSNYNNGWAAIGRLSLERDWGEIPRQHIRLTPAGRGVEQLQTDYATGLRLLVTLSGLLLLIGCANVANLLLARGSANRSQTAVRLALGAARSRLVRQMLTESVLLALLGGAAGVYVAYAGSRAILVLAFRGAHYIPIDARPSLPVLVFAVLMSVATGIVFGMAPAWIASRSHPADALRGVGRSTGDRSSGVQKSLVVMQVAFSIVLLIGAGLLTKSLRNLEAQHFGFVTEGRLIVNVNPSLAGYTEGKLAGLYQRLEQAVPRIPGVLNASLSTYSPLEGNNWNERVYIEGKAPDYRETAPSWLRIGPHYFETIGTPLIRGRAIDEQDTPTAPHVAVINETFVRRFFPGENPIGQHFGMGDASHSGDYEIVGIVEDAKYQDTRGPAYATFFLPLLQTPSGDPLRGWVGAIELHVAGRPENLESAVRKALADVDPNLTVLDTVELWGAGGAQLQSGTTNRAPCGAVRHPRSRPGVRRAVRRNSIMRSRDEPTRSASAWHSAPSARRSSRWCCAALWSNSPGAWRSAFRWRWREDVCLRISFTA